MQAGDDASWNEWTNKIGGMRKPGGGQKHGIVRTIDSDGDFIEEATFNDDEPHGLSFTWTDNFTAFQAAIYDHGEWKAYICWNADWSEVGSSGNSELILENNGLSIFKP